MIGGNEHNFDMSFLYIPIKKYYHRDKKLIMFMSGFKKIIHAMVFLDNVRLWKVRSMANVRLVDELSELEEDVDYGYAVEVGSS